MALLRKKSVMPTEHDALPGRPTPLDVPQTHFVNGHRIAPPFPNEPWPSKAWRATSCQRSPREIEVRIS